MPTYFSKPVLEINPEHLKEGNVTGVPECLRRTSPRQDAERGRLPAR